MLIIGWNFHFDPLGSSGILLEICAALSLNLLMTQTVIQEPTWATAGGGGDDDDDDALSLNLLMTQILIQEPTWATY